MATNRVGVNAHLGEKGRGHGPGVSKAAAGGWDGSLRADKRRQGWGHGAGAGTYRGAQRRLDRPPVRRFAATLSATGVLPCLVVALGVLPAGCGSEGAPAVARVTEPTLSGYEQVVPSDGLPQEVRDGIQPANNNLDVVLHDGRFFLAFRTGPTHFASADTALYVVSSTDRRSWSFEARLSENKDVREPRFLSFEGNLYLYFAVLGTNPLDFEPGLMKATRRLGAAQWTAPETIYEPGFIPWRAKTVSGTAYLLAYEGGENIYDFTREPVKVHWLTTDNGFDWVPVVPGQPIVLEGGSSETDFVFLDDGSLAAVSRNEMGDQSGWGMKLCRARPEALGDWECAWDPRKYDSPLLFRHGGEVYLIGRRNVTETGFYDLQQRQLGDFVQTLAYELDYWLRPKRCSLWRLDPRGPAAEFVLDLPSCGDTCFPGLVPLGGGNYLIYNYTSPLEQEEDPFWLQGQLGPTLIYSIVLSLP